ncbi:hypothetical protein B0H10DRAFT_87040 [Mycena sp. CBHHK59/15]|nr:hypothetical protein B0H10DRAFT_87040 [Mycena sp. CBHHK59/15]
MFSKILALGLCALALTHAAPSLQMSMVSCSVNVETSQAVGVQPDITPGYYQIYNAVPQLGLLRSYKAGEPIFVSATREWPGPFGNWEVKKVGDYQTIRNVGLDANIRGRNGDGDLTTGSGPGQPFVIEPAYGDFYVVRDPADNKVWTTDGNPIRSNVHLEQPMNELSDRQLWRFVRVEV